MSSLHLAQCELRQFASPDRARMSARFFKTGPGQYGEGDVFIGVRVPDLRKVAAKFREIKRIEIDRILKSPVHEDRLLALVILTLQFKKFPQQRKQIFDFYLSRKKYINNWDLVDVTTPTIVGGWLENQDRSVLYRLVRSRRLWDRRIAVLTTASFISKKDFKDIERMAVLLLRDPEDLIHKAVGWMLREVGKRDLSRLRKFLDRYASRMPRTMLRYSIEKLSQTERRRYLSQRA